VERFVEALATATKDEELLKRVNSVADSAGRLEEDRKTYGWPELEQLIGQQGQEVVDSVRDWLRMVPVRERGTSAAKKVRTGDASQPFPGDALPEPIREYVRQGSLALGCDPAYLALPALTTVASAIGNTRTLRLKKGWDEPCIIWSAIVGESGTLKTPAFKHAVRHLYAVQERLLIEARAEMVRWKDEIEVWKAMDTAARGEKGGRAGRRDE